MFRASAAVLRSTTLSESEELLAELEGLLQTRKTIPTTTEDHSVFVEILPNERNGKESNQNRNRDHNQEEGRGQDQDHDSAQRQKNKDESDLDRNQDSNRNPDSRRNHDRNREESRGRNQDYDFAQKQGQYNNDQSSIPPRTDNGKSPVSADMKVASDAEVCRDVRDSINTSIRHSDEQYRMLRNLLIASIVLPIILTIAAIIITIKALHMKFEGLYMSVELLPETIESNLGKIQC